jgi:hypothetical protein
VVSVSLVLAPSTAQQAAEVVEAIRDFIQDVIDSGNRTLRGNINSGLEQRTLLFRQQQVSTARCVCHRSAAPADSWAAGTLPPPPCHTRTPPRPQPRIPPSDGPLIAPPLQWHATDWVPHTLPITEDTDNSFQNAGQPHNSGNPLAQPLLSRYSAVLSLSRNPLRGGLCPHPWS